MGLDGPALAVSALCLIHCLAVPLLASLLPAALPIGESELLHRAAVLTAAAIAAPAALRIGRGSGRVLILGLFAAGLASLFGGAFAEALEERETVLTVIGALALSGGHILRWRLRGA